MGFAISLPDLDNTSQWAIWNFLIGHP